MSDEAQSLSGSYAEAEALCKKLDTFPSSNNSEFQDVLSAAITAYEACIRIASQISLFSPNEALDDVSSRDLRYLLLHYQIAELVFRSNRGERKDIILQARSELEQFLHLLDQYDVLSKADLQMLERYQDNRDGFALAPGGDAAARREVKIQRFREEKALKARIEVRSRRSMVA